MTRESLKHQKSRVQAANKTPHKRLLEARSENQKEHGDLISRKRTRRSLYGLLRGLETGP